MTRFILGFGPENDEDATSRQHRREHCRQNIRIRTALTYEPSHDATENCQSNYRREMPKSLDIPIS